MLSNKCVELLVDRAMMVMIIMIETDDNHIVVDVDMIMVRVDTNPQGKMWKLIVTRTATTAITTIMSQVKLMPIQLMNKQTKDETAICSRYFAIINFIRRTTTAINRWVINIQ